jgi:predicted amidohydrolase
MTGFGVDQEANRAKGEESCRRASDLGADIALFPEMWNIAYTPCPSDREGRLEWIECAISRNGAFVRSFRRLARELDMAIAITYLERTSGAPRDSVSLIDREGRIRLNYSKVHTCDFDWEAVLEPGRGFNVCSLSTSAGDVRVGAMICYDREFPESARVLMLRGAEIVLVPNWCKMNENRLAQLRVRAFENMIGVAMANYAGGRREGGPDGQPGHSAAFDPIVVDEEGRSRDPLIVEAGEEEGVYLATFDLSRLRRWRETETWGNAYRKPRAYGGLLSKKALPPFLRPDAR